MMWIDLRDAQEATGATVVSGGASHDEYHTIGAVRVNRDHIVMFENNDDVVWVSLTNGRMFRFTGEAAEIAWAELLHYCAPEDLGAEQT